MRGRRPYGTGLRAGAAGHSREGVACRWGCFESGAVRGEPVGAVGVAVGSQMCCGGNVTLHVL